MSSRSGSVQRDPWWKSLLWHPIEPSHQAIDTCTSCACLGCPTFDPCFVPCCGMHQKVGMHQEPRTNAGLFQTNLGPKQLPNLKGFKLSNYALMNVFSIMETCCNPWPSDRSLGIQPRTRSAHCETILACFLCSQRSF